MEILVAVIVIAGFGLGYRYWRARNAHDASAAFQP